MKKITKIFSVSSLIALALSMISCESREQMSYGDGTPIASPLVYVVGTTWNSISYSWAPVDGAVEYGYFFYDEKGELIEGDLTKLTEVTINGLNYNANYTMKVYAYSAVNHESASSTCTEVTTMSGFFDVINNGGTYTSAITGKEWTTPVLTETRTNEREFGKFKLSSWYNKTGYDLEFEVYNDSLIHVTNGTIDEASGLPKVMAGPSTIATNSYVRKGALINEEKSRFDAINKTLSLYVIATTGEKEGSDTFVWE